MPLTASLQQKLIASNKGKLCTQCQKNERYLYLEWCNDCIYAYVMSEKSPKDHVFNIAPECAKHLQGDFLNVLS